ncbi:hypothetical protein WJX72_002332 [[Myrmecia] bisecta]|uniref:SWIM-type domain-containing protein n=1 Tax=[Myrmecia] bisecta TaxID=41462 RepID=A0AAW1QPL1_9CHLO
MGERLAPWRAKPPKAVAELIEQAASVRLYLVQRPGPTSFILSDEGQQHKHKVNVGARPSCTCRPEHAFACKELCIHVLFVMLRVLRLPPSNPLCWQLSLIDRELEEVLHWGSRLASRPETAAAPGSQTAVARRPLEEEDACAICYEAMRARPGVARDDLVHCRYGCGHNVHARCLKVWAGHQATLHQELTLAKQHSTDQLREARSKPAVVATPQKQLGRSMKPAAKRQHPAKEPKLSQEPLDRLSLVGTGLGLR